MSTTTTYFTHCWGVFEGGGVRASAHAGAFAAARAAGVTFGRVAGTSGGSIVAALVAAGATPEFIRDALENTPLASFLGPASSRDSVFKDRPPWLIAARQATWGKSHALATVALDSGLYSSEPIQTWLEEKLRSALAPQRPLGIKRPVSFEELKPLHVVATDLTAGAPRVWSREKTPTASVAFAVRCSCSIPFFYQAIGDGSAVLVDGGVVSNLPAFVFANLLAASDARSVLSRVLCFRLFADVSTVRSRPSGFLDFAHQLADSAIDGATEIQQSLQADVYTVKINTGSIGSTDFEGTGQKEKAALYKAGAEAVEEFIRNERLEVRANVSARVYRGYDEKLLLLVQALRSCEQTAWAVGVSTYWLLFTFPTVLAAMRKGIRLHVLTTPNSEATEVQRRTLLRRLGAAVYEVADLPFSGFLFDPESEAACAVLSSTRGRVGTDYDYDEERVRLYTASCDAPVLSSLWSLIAGQSAKASDAPPAPLPYAECPPGELFERLRRVSQYRHAKFNMEQVQLTPALLVVQQAVKEYKALQIQQLVKEFKEASCALFAPQKVLFPDGSDSILTPPVLERTGDKLVVIEGNTRVFHCYWHGESPISAVVVENVEALLPAKPYSLSDLKLTSATRTLTDNFRDIDRSLFRRIEEAVHS